MTKRLVAALCVIPVFMSVLFGCNGCEAGLKHFVWWDIVGSTPPSWPIDPGELAGAWHSWYQGVEDHLIIRSDGTFKQIATQPSRSYRWESSWNEWWPEHREDGNVWLHLEGGREYVPGIDLAERGGMHCVNDDCTRLRPKPYSDPFSDTPVNQTDELILVIRRTRYGDLVLLHMCMSRDGCNLQYFSRVSE